MIKTKYASWLRIDLSFVLGLCLLGTGGLVSLRAAQSPGKPVEKAPATQASLDADEQSALNDAFRSAGNNPQIIIKNLEAFLERFPHSSRREVVLRTICTYALQANAPGVAVQYGQMLLEMTPNNSQLLTLIIDALARQNDQASRTRAIDYTSRLLAIAEGQRTRAAATDAGKDTREQWAQYIAGIYAQRAGFYRDSGDLDKAIADDEKSYATYPAAGVAEQLGDAALKKGDSARAADYYLTAFIFPDKSPDPVRRQEIRRKLGSLYVAQHHSEARFGRPGVVALRLPYVATRRPLLRRPAAERRPPRSFRLRPAAGGWHAAAPGGLPRQGHGDGLLGDLVRPLPPARQTRRAGGWKFPCGFPTPSSSR